MTAPTFKKATSTSPGDATKYGAPDLKYAFDVLDGSHATDRLQITNIEGRDRYATYAFLVRQSSPTAYEAIRSDTGAVAYSGSDFGTVMNSVIGALPAPSSTSSIGVVYISGTTLDCATTSITIDKPVIIDGFGSAVVRKTADYVGTNRSVFNIASSNVTLRDFTIDVTIQVGTATRPIVCQPSTASLSNILIENVTIKKAYNPIYLHASTGTSHLIDHVIIRNVKVDNTGSTQTGPGFVIGLGCKDVAIEHCTILEPGDIGIDIFATRELIKVWGNTIQKITNTTGDGIVVSNYGATTSIAGAPTKNVVIRDNRIVGPLTGDCIKIWGAAEKVTITGNRLNGDNGTGTTVTTGSGIVIREKTISATDYWAKEVIVTNNIILNIGSSGVYVGSSTSAVEFQAFNITGNYIHDINGYGINIISGVKNAIVNNNLIYRYGKDQVANRAGIHIRISTNNTMMGNKIFGLTGSSTPTAGSPYWSIYEENTSDSNIMVGNSMNQPISFVGAASIIAQNDGFKTEAAGTANATTVTTTVTHGLGYTPALKDISVTPTTTWGAMTKFWIESPTSTQFTIKMDNAATVTFAWQVTRMY
jgi:hypothetical protein